MTTHIHRGSTHVYTEDSYIIDVYYDMIWSGCYPLASCLVKAKLSSLHYSEPLHPDKVINNESDTSLRLYRCTLFS